MPLLQQAPTAIYPPVTGSDLFRPVRKLKGKFFCLSSDISKEEAKKS
jgi:hypothetical protein